MIWTVIGKEQLASQSGGLNRYVNDFCDSLEAAEIPFVAHFVAGRTGRNFRIHKAKSTWLRVLKLFIAGLGSGNTNQIINSHFSLFGLPYFYGAAVRNFIGGSKSTHQLVVHFHGPWWLESKAAGEKNRISLAIKRSIDLAMLTKAKQVITLSRAFAIEAGRFTDAAKIQVIQPGVAKKWFVEPLFEPDERSVNLICVRRLTHRMGILELLESLEALNFSIQNQPIDLMVVGDGELRDQIARWVEQNQRTAAVHLLGNITDVELVASYQKSHVAVIPTKTLEGFGLVALEAMASGIPVISTGEGGLRESLGPWSSKDTTFDLGDAQSLETALTNAAKLSSNPELRKEIVSYAASFSWELTLNRVLTAVGYQK